MLASCMLRHTPWRLERSRGAFTSVPMLILFQDSIGGLHWACIRSKRGSGEEGMMKCESKTSLSVLEAGCVYSARPCSSMRRPAVEALALADACAAPLPLAVAAALAAACATPPLVPALACAAALALAAAFGCRFDGWLAVACAAAFAAATPPCVCAVACACAAAMAPFAWAAAFASAVAKPPAPIACDAALAKAVAVGASGPPAAVKAVACACAAATVAGFSLLPACRRERQSVPRLAAAHR